MKLSSKTFLAAIILPTLLSACASQQQSDAAMITAQDLQHHNWQLVMIDDEALASDPRQQKARLEIGENLTANGSAGCNNFFGQAELKDNQLKIERMAMTMKMCPPEAMKIERAMAETLAEWATISLSQEMLVLENDAHKLTFKLDDHK
ncbi:META domain-containing protein [Vibrio sp.]|uniref:META domain-containing protein n=1 Tax=Vibrio sp. TaxID=678 RepID=UPI003D1305AA